MADASLDSLLAELRSAMLAFLDHPEDPPTRDVVAHWDPLQERLRAAVAAIDSADIAGAPPLEQLDDLLSAYSAYAKARGKPLIVMSPLYPWGVTTIVKGLREQLRYRHLVQAHAGPCNCAFVLEHRLFGQLESKDFIKIGTSDEYYDPYDEYRCPHCQRLWQYVDASTEQYNARCWRSPDKG